MQLGAGHTSGDIVAWVPDAEVMFSGDLIEYHSACYCGDAHLREWPTTLNEIRAEYPAGLHCRHVAWIWRRILTILGFAHAKDVVHAAVLPEHILIEPKEHKLLLIDWCCAAMNWQHNTAPIPLTAGYRDWYACESALGQPPTPRLDVAFAARCMIELLGGDPVSAEFPTSTPPGLQRHFLRCLSRRTADAAIGRNFPTRYDQGSGNKDGVRRRMHDDAVRDHRYP